MKGGLKMKDLSTSKVNCNECKHFIKSFCFVHQKRIQKQKRERYCKYFLSDDLPKYEYYVEDYEDFEEDENDFS